VFKLIIPKTDLAVHCPVVKNEVLRSVIWNICPTLTVCSLGDDKTASFSLWFGRPCQSPLFS